MDPTQRSFASSLCLAGLTVLTTVCSSERPRRPETWQAAVDTIGDTVVVRTVSGSVWGSVSVEPEVIIGNLDGAEEHIFGRIGALAPAPDGHLYVLDTYAGQIRLYESDGTFARNIGRRGEGPGEYREVAALATTADNVLVVWDVGNLRISRFDSAGESLAGWRVQSVAHWGINDLLVDDAGHVLVRTLLRGATSELDPQGTGWIRFAPGGSPVDTVTPPAHLPPPPYSGRFGPQRSATWHPSGWMVAGVNDRYSFDIVSPHGIRRIERTADPVRIPGGERNQWDAVVECERSVTDPGEAPWVESPTPTVKPYYRYVTVGALGRIWVRRFGPARETDPLDPDAPREKGCRSAVTWMEPHESYDVFDVTGRFLGRVEMPEKAKALAMRGDRVWGVQLGDFDEEYVVRWRLVH